MSVNYKPAGYTSVAPYLVVRDARATLDFLEKVFDAQRLRYYERPDGSVMHVEARIDDTVLMLGESTKSWPESSTNVHIYVRDVDAVYRRALEAGATPLQAPARKDDDDKRGGVEAHGTSWWIATQMAPEGTR